jgi:predicted Zn-dependent protease
MSDVTVLEPAVSSLEKGLVAAQDESARNRPEAALAIWATLRRNFPDNPVAYLRAASTLSKLGRHDEAERLLSAGSKHFPDQVGFTIERAWAAHHRGDFDQADRLWEEVRKLLPDHHAGFTGAANSLRSAGRFDDADEILAAAMSKFPDDAGVAAEYAWLAHHRRDWPQALSRWQAARDRFPNLQAGYVAGAVALREAARLEEAEDLLRLALARFPGEQAPLVEHAWLATAQRNWPEAVSRWQRVRQHFPRLITGYHRGANALIEMRQFPEADALLTEGMELFPNAGELLHDHAWIALWQHREDEAALRFRRLRELFPNFAAGYVGGAICLRNQFKFVDAENLLERGHALLPNEPRILLEHAQIPATLPTRRDRNYDEALRRLESLRTKFPQFDEGYAATIRMMRDDNRLSESDTFGAITAQQMPHSGAVALEHAHTARALADWAAALRRYSDVWDRFPQQAHGGIGVAHVLSLSGKHGEAEAVLRDVMLRFPNEKAAFAEFASVAVRRSDAKEALARWTEAYRRFPDEVAYAQHIFNAQIQLSHPGSDAFHTLSSAVQAMQQTAEYDGPAKKPEGPIDQSTRDVVMQFESLGGSGHGCEFGIFQRSQGAEPLGLLRWADLSQDQLADGLKKRFDGVGLPEYTNIFVPDNANEYWTTDKRYVMAMRSFIRTDEMSLDKVTKQICRRLQFLRGKLIEDLEQGAKIFVYKNMYRNLTDDELARLHKAVRSYGDNMFLYVRYETADRPTGAVEIAGDGLMIGYIDHFSFSPDDEPIGPATEGWLAVCRRALQIWSVSRSGPRR